MENETGSVNLEPVHSSIRRAIIVCIVCTALVCSIFIFYARRIERTSNAREQLIQEIQANEQSRHIASKIMLQIDKARSRETINEMWVHLDEIETLALKVMGGE